MRMQPRIIFFWGAFYLELRVNELVKSNKLRYFRRTVKRSDTETLGSIDFNG